MRAPTPCCDLGHAITIAATRVNHKLGDWQKGVWSRSLRAHWANCLSALFAGPLHGPWGHHGRVTEAHSEMSSAVRSKKHGLQRLSSFILWLSSNFHKISWFETLNVVMSDTKHNLSLAFTRHNMIWTYFLIYVSLSLSVSLLTRSSKQ